MQLGCGCGCLLVLIFLIACGLLGFGFTIYQNPIVIVWLILVAILTYITNEIYEKNALFGYDLGLTKSQKNITTGLFALLMVIVTGVCGLVMYVGQQKEEARLNNEAKAIYEEIQADYEQGNYDKVSDDFKKLDKYKKTAYAQKAKQDFGDYDDKLKEKQKAENEAKKEAMKSKKEPNEVDGDLSSIKVEYELDYVRKSPKERKFIVHITNTSDYIWDGTVTLIAKGIGVSDGIFFLKLKPGESTDQYGFGDVNEYTDVRVSVRGKFYDDGKHLNKNLNYTVVRKEIANNLRGCFYIYTDDRSDANLTAIAKDFKANYLKEFDLLEIRFTDNTKNPVSNETYAMYCNRGAVEGMAGNLVEIINNGRDVGRIIARDI